MKTLVTGGAGFIGSHLIKRLLAEGHSVVCVDNMNPYYDPALKRARLAEFEKKITFYEVDIADLEALSKVFEKHLFDTVYHLAAQAGVRYSLSHPEVYVRSNVEGTRNVLELAGTHGAPHVIFASSSSVYGDLPAAIFMEDAKLGTPLSPYAETKQKGEELCKEYAEKYSMPISILRFFTVYGPWGRPDMAPYLFTEKILKGEPVVLHNNGDMKRDFTYIDDIIDGVILASKNIPVGYEIYNLGQGAPVPLMGFVEVLEHALGKTAEKTYVPMQPGEVKETYASISKAQTMLGYYPKKLLFKERIQKFVDWYLAYHNKQ